MSFVSLGLSNDLLQAIELAGFQHPTFIQANAIPVLLKGKDLIAQSKTGTGKTASFVLPLLHLFQLQPVLKRKELKGLILTPTRELAIQVADVIKVFARGLKNPMRSVLLVGGLNIDLQIRNLHHGADIAVATPGRLLDLINRRVIDLTTIDFLIIDEADKMFDLGFSDELTQVLKALPKKRQNALFSATIDEEVIKLTASFMHEPVHVQAKEEVPTVVSIHQRAIEVNRNNRGPLLRHLMATEAWEQTLIFIASIQAADIVATKLRHAGFSADALHGGMTQAQRMTVLNDFKNKNIKVLVATDIIARGIDIDKLPVVVNYDLPRSSNDYIHRIGRTARAGMSGVAISFIGHEDKAHFALIEKRIQAKLVREQVKGFELTGEGVVHEQGKAPIKGKRMSKKDKARALAKQQG